jgi:hypothetical protein
LDKATSSADIFGNLHEQDAALAVAITSAKWLGGSSRKEIGNAKAASQGTLATPLLSTNEE